MNKWIKDKENREKRVQNRPIFVTFTYINKLTPLLLLSPTYLPTCPPSNCSFSAETIVNNIGSAIFHYCSHFHIKPHDDRREERSRYAFETFPPNESILMDFWTKDIILFTSASVLMHIIIIGGGCGRGNYMWTINMWKGYSLLEQPFREWVLPTNHSPSHLCFS